MVCKHLTFAVGNNGCCQEGRSRTSLQADECHDQRTGLDLPRAIMSIERYVVDLGLCKAVVLHMPVSEGLFVMHSSGEGRSDAAGSPHCR